RPTFPPLPPWLGCRAKAIACKGYYGEAEEWLAANRAPERAQRIFKAAIGAGSRQQSPVCGGICRASAERYSCVSVLLAKPAPLAIVLWFLVFFISAASSSRCSAARRPRGRSRRGHSRRESCRPLGSWARLRLQPGANGSPLLCNDCATSVGSRVVPSRSSIAGLRDATSGSSRSLPSSSSLKWIALSRRG